MKKISLLLFGICKMKYKHWKKPYKFINIYWYNSYNNYKEYIIDYYKSLGYEIDIYICTNNIDDNEKNKLLNTYKPIKYIFINNENDKWLSRNLKFKKVIELCLNSKINYEFTIITRFDLLFMKKFEISNIDYNLINNVSILENNNVICDNFFIIPYNLLNIFYKNIVENLKNDNFHYKKKDIEKICKINYILNEKKRIDKLNFYKIVR